MIDTDDFINNILTKVGVRFEDLNLNEQVSIKFYGADVLKACYNEGKSAGVVEGRYYTWA